MLSRTYASSFVFGRGSFVKLSYSFPQAGKRLGQRAGSLAPTRLGGLFSLLSVLRRARSISLTHSGDAGITEHNCVRLAFGTEEMLCTYVM